MAKNLFKAFVCLSLLAAYGCLDGVRSDEVLAEAAGKRLMRSQTAGIYPGPLSADDSLKVLEAYVENWARRQVKLREAETLVAGSGYDIESMVNDYRNNLLALRLDQHYADSRVDTMLSDEAVRNYYDEHMQELRLDRPIVRGRIARIPNSSRQQARLREYMASPRADRQQDFRDICEKNGYEVTVFDSWTDFEEFLSWLPTRRGTDYTSLLSRRGVQEMADADNKYYFEITDRLGKGDAAPLERVRDAVRRIVFNQRRGEVIRACEDSLYRAALDAGEVKINVRR